MCSIDKYSLSHGYVRLLADTTVLIRGPARYASNTISYPISTYLLMVDHWVDGCVRTYWLNHEVTAIGHMVG